MSTIWLKEAPIRGPLIAARIVSEVRELFPRIQISGRIVTATDSDKPKKDSGYYRGSFVVIDFADGGGDAKKCRLSVYEQGSPFLFQATLSFGEAQPKYTFDEPHIHEIHQQTRVVQSAAALIKLWLSGLDIALPLPIKEGEHLCDLITRKSG